MGTEIQPKTYFPVYNSTRNLNNGIWSLFSEEKSSKNGDYFSSLLKWKPENRYSGYDHEKEKMRQTILKHESIFRHQLEELHRLYRRQKELMNEIRLREVEREDRIEAKPGFFKPNFFVENSKGDEDLNPKIENFQTRMCFGKNLNLNEPAKADETFDHDNKIEKRRKNMIFGVEIPDENHDHRQKNHVFDLNDSNQASDQENHENSGLLRFQIDLNMSLNEEEEEEEQDDPPVLEQEQELNTIRTAAEAIISISSCQTAPDDSLLWFADIVSSYKITDFSEQDEGFVPDGMDYFEFMTLQLEEEHGYKPKNSDEQPQTVDGDQSPLKRGRRRGQTRRGRRQRKDFQRDILPSLVPLSRYEVTEDFQTFEEILRASGGDCVWRNAVKPKAGRRRLGCLKQTTETLVFSPLIHGWGRRTRRAPRRRYRSGNHELKC